MEKVRGHNSEGDSGAVAKWNRLGVADDEWQDADNRGRRRSAATRREIERRTARRRRSRHYQDD